MLIHSQGVTYIQWWLVRPQFGEKDKTTSKNNKRLSGTDEQKNRN